MKTTQGFYYKDSNGKDIYFIPGIMDVVDNRISYSPIILEQRAERILSRRAELQRDLNKGSAFCFKIPKTHLEQFSKMVWIGQENYALFKGKEILELMKEQVNYEQQLRFIGSFPLENSCSDEEYYHNAGEWWKRGELPDIDMRGWGDVSKWE